MFEFILNNKWLLAFGTFMLFAVKGVAWIVVPAIVIRYRSRTKRAAQEKLQG